MHIVKPIILFDLNGTLCHRDKKDRKVFIRPFIQNLILLKDLYTLGIYTSMMEYNAWKIIKQIEGLVGEELFDRSYIFCRNYTIPFTDEEIEKYNISPWKTKKSIEYILKDEFAVIVDDEEVKIVEKDRAIIIPSYYEFNRKDRELYNLVNSLVGINE